MQKVYKMYDTSAADADAAASLDIQEDGVIEGILVSMLAISADALNDGGRYELSFASTNGFVSNDTRASIAGWAAGQGFLTTGGSQVGVNLYVPMEVPINAGERIYLHHDNTGAITIECSVWVYVRIGGNTGLKRPNFR